MKYNYQWTDAFNLAFKGERSLLDDHINVAYTELVLPAIQHKYRQTDSADLASEVMSKFWERFYVLEETLPDNVNGYLYTMSINKVFHATKQKTKLNIKKVDLEDIDLKQMLLTSDTDDTALHQEKEVKYQAMESAIKRLCETCRALIQLSYFGNRKLKDCHQELGIPTANAASKKKIKCMNKLIRYAYEELTIKKNIKSIENTRDYA